MKKLLVFLIIVFVLLTPVFAGGKKEASKEEKDYVKMSFDQLVEEAKAEGEMVFYTWWGENHWVEAGKEFEAKYGIKTKVIVGDHQANANKIISEGKQETGTIDAMMIGGDHLKPVMDLGLFYPDTYKVLPDYDKLAPNLREYVEGIKNNGELVPLYRNQTGLLYNPAKVKNPPQRLG